MKDDEIYNTWNEFINDSKYCKYFISNNEYWKNRLEEVKQFINDNQSRPTIKTNKELSIWISSQLISSNKRLHIMKDDEIYNTWNEFVNDARYKKYFDLDNIRDWKNRINELKQFMNDNKSRPTEKTNKELCRWLQIQVTNSKKRLQIMKIDEIYNLWNEFINDSRYKQYFK